MSGHDRLTALRVVGADDLAELLRRLSPKPNHMAPRLDAGRREMARAARQATREWFVGLTYLGEEPGPERQCPGCGARVRERMAEPPNPDLVDELAVVARRARLGTKPQAGIDRQIVTAVLAALAGVCATCWARVQVWRARR